MSTPPTSKAKQLAGYSFLVALANDHRIDEAELHMLEKLALADGVVDEAEKHVLHNIFSRVTKEELAEKVWAEMQRFKQQQGIA